MLFSSVAAAQSRDPFERDGQSDLSDLLHSDVAGSRQQPGMGENGVRIGSVIVKADAKAVMAGNSNILNRPTNARSDVYVVFEQTARLTTDWTHHQIAVKANAEVARFANSAKQNRETFGAEASGRLDITKRASAFARVAVAQKVELRETPGEANLDGGPAEFKQIEAQVGVRTDEGNLRLTTSAIVTKRIYADIALQDGKTENQDFRDSNTLSINVRADHALPSGAIAFATGTGTRIESPNAGPCCDRSASAGVRTQGGSVCRRFRRTVGRHARDRVHGADGARVGTGCYIFRPQLSLRPENI